MEPTKDAGTRTLYRSESNSVAQKGRVPAINQRTMSDYQHNAQQKRHSPRIIDELLEDGSFLADEDIRSDIYDDEEFINEQHHNKMNHQEAESCCYSVSPSSSSTPKLQHRTSTDQRSVEDEEDDESLLPPINLSTLDSVEIGTMTNDGMIPEHWNSSHMLSTTNARATSSILYDNSSGVSRCLLSLNQSLNESVSPQLHSRVSDDEETTTESIVTLSIYRPHFPKEATHSFDGAVKCRILVLPVPITQSIDDLADVSIFTENLSTLPNVIKAFRVPKDAIVALEFFRSQSTNILSPSICEGRVFIPSYLFHLVASKDLYIPTGSEKCLSQVIPDHSFDSVTVELPLDLCHGNLPPPVHECDAENSFIFIAEQLESGYSNVCPIARFSITASPSLMQISPRTSVRLRHSPRENSSSTYEPPSDRRYATSVSPPSSYRPMMSPERPNSRSFSRPAVPRLRYLPPPSTSVAISALHHHGRSNQDHAPRRYERDEIDILTESTHNYKAHTSNRQMNSKDFDLSTPHDVDDFEMVTPHVVVPQSFGKSIRHQEKEERHSVTESIERHRSHRSPPRGRPIVKRFPLDANASHMGSLRSKSSTVSSSASIQHHTSINSSAVSSIEHQNKRYVSASSNVGSRRTAEIDCHHHQQQPVLWNSPRDYEEDESCESYELFQSPLPSARARHSMPPATYRLATLDISPDHRHPINQEYNRDPSPRQQPTYHTRPQVSPRIVSHQLVKQSPRLEQRFDPQSSLSVLSSPRTVNDPSTMKSLTTALPSPRTRSNVRSSPRLNHRTSTTQNQTCRASPRDHVSHPDAQTIATRAPLTANKSPQEKLIYNVEKKNASPRSSSATVSDLLTATIDDNRNNQTISTIASRSQLNSNNLGVHSVGDEHSSSSNSNVVHRSWCTRRRKTQRVTERATDRLIRRRLNELLMGLRDDQLPSRQSSGVVSTSSTIASSIQVSNEELIGADHYLGCKNCARRKNHHELHDDADNAAAGIQSSKPPRLLRYLLCCCPCFIMPIVAVCSWIRKTVRGFLVA